MESSFAEIMSAPGAKKYPYTFPQSPFEHIGFALSGGGFRAASYGLGVLSLMNEVKLDEASTLLQKIRFISSASGGTITLIAYEAALHKGMSFHAFYHQLNYQLTGEGLLQEAIALLENDAVWMGQSKTRNLINAFSMAYHNRLLAFNEKEEERTLGFIMNGEGKKEVHIEEFCFNASEFYTGIWFRFQGSGQWSPTRGGVFGNNNIEINWEARTQSIEALKKIRLADVLAASSCFPLGFEPIIYPEDFSYKGGPDTNSLKGALKLNTYSWDDQKTPEQNRRSPRAEKEKKFSDVGQFGLMDGGICDNQGLYSLLAADRRKGGTDDGSGHRFDLLMVSDVTSFYMTPYSLPAIPGGKPWTKKTPADYWEKIRKGWKRIPGLLSAGWLIAIAILVLFTLPFFLEGKSVAATILLVVGLLPLVAMAIAHTKINRFKSERPKLAAALNAESLQELFREFFPKDNFVNRVSLKVIEYLQRTKTGVIVQMINARAQSAATMIGDVFLKHIRRLIYEMLFNNFSYKYRRMDNSIYKLTFTNDKNRRRPSFDEPEDEDPVAYAERREKFYAEAAEACLITEEMQVVAEAAYNAGTTLWFEKEQEQGQLVTRKALIATGQFTTCYNLLAYALSLKHSRYFGALPPAQQARIGTAVAQLKDLMKAFATNPYYLYEKYEATRPAMAAQVNQREQG